MRQYDETAISKFDVRLTSGRQVMLVFKEFILLYSVSA